MDPVKGDTAFDPEKARLFRFNGKVWEDPNSDGVTESYLARLAELQETDLRADLAETRAALRDLIETMGVEMNDKRLGYIVAQVDRNMLERAMRILSD